MYKWGLYAPPQEPLGFLVLGPRTHGSPWPPSSPSGSAHMAIPESQTPELPPDSRNHHSREADFVKWTFSKHQGRTALCLFPTTERGVPVGEEGVRLAAPQITALPRPYLSLSAHSLCLCGKHQASLLPQTFMQTRPEVMSQVDAAPPT